MGSEWHCKVHLLQRPRETRQSIGKTYEAFPPSGAAYGENLWDYGRLPFFVGLCPCLRAPRMAATVNLGIFCPFSIICLSCALAVSAYQYLELRLVWPKHCYYVDVFLHDYFQRLACWCLVLQTLPAQHSHSQLNDYQCVFVSS